MEFQVPINIPSLDPPISYQHSIMLTGSCFTEHIGGRLRDLKFRVLENSNGILFDPASVCNSLVSYVEPKRYLAQDLVLLNELWQSWDHHSRFSGIDQYAVLARINASQLAAHEFLEHADWLIITLGSAFSYRLSSNGQPVANCHRAPTQTFQKQMMSIEEIVTGFDTAIHRLLQFNRNLRILFTISPVRHIRDGVVDNNRSKARLIESVHHLVNKFDRLHYFPAYELVIDVLRDYRFYDIDLVHPNYTATNFVFDHFTEACLDEQAKTIIPEIRKINIARNHRAFHPETLAHRQFLANFAAKTTSLQQQYPFIDLSEEIKWFEG